MPTLLEWPKIQFVSVYGIMMNKYMEKEIDIDRRKIVIYKRVNDVPGLLMFVIILLGSIAFTFARIYWSPMSPPYWDIGLMFLVGMEVLGIILMFIFIMSMLGMYILPWYYRRQANALRYCLGDRALRVESGVLFRSRKTIPFEKITSLELVQGPLLWYLGMWIVKVQTASTGLRMPEATLWGVINPDQVREDILTAKEEFAAKKDNKER